MTVSASFGAFSLLRGAACPLLSRTWGNKPRQPSFVTPRRPRREPLILRVENMAKALTVRTIDTLATPATRREVPDGLVNGLYLVLQPSGARSWAVRYRNPRDARASTRSAPIPPST